MTELLSPLERRVYHYLLDFLAENTYQPSVREIARRFRIKSTKSVADILASLAEKGYIERGGARSRGVKLVGYSTVGRTQPVPLYARLHRGQQPLHDADRERYVTLDRAFVPSEDSFFLRVDGDSMVGRGIQHRDMVLVSPSVRAHDGDLIAARVGSASVVRTLQHRGASIVLESSTADDPEIVVGPSDDFAVAGVVVAVFRPFFEETSADDAAD